MRFLGGWALLLVVASLAAPTFGQSERAHFHHVRLNVTDPEATVDFYRNFLGAVEVEYRGLKPALFTERSFLLLNKVEEAARSGPKTAISHIGWAGIDGPGEYEWLESQGETADTIGGHAGISDTSQLLHVAPEHIRDDRRAPLGGFDGSGVSGDPTRASAARGRRGIELKVEAAVRQIETLMAER